VGKRLERRGRTSWFVLLSFLLMPTSSTPTTSLGLVSSMCTGGASLLVPLAGLGEPCWRADGRNEERVANMADYNEHETTRFHKGRTHRCRGRGFRCLGARQAVD
jgi:hypothetical protein